jgi:hypothetical protein
VLRLVEILPFANCFRFLIGFDKRLRRSLWGDREGAPVSRIGRSDYRFVGGWSQKSVVRVFCLDAGSCALFWRIEGPVRTG